MYLTNKYETDCPFLSNMRYHCNIGRVFPTRTPNNATFRESYYRINAEAHDFCLFVVPAPLFYRLRNPTANIIYIPIYDIMI